jgi:hypothetical protein
MEYKDAFLMAGLVFLYKGADPKIAAARAADFVKALTLLQDIVVKKEPTPNI